MSSGEERNGAERLWPVAMDALKGDGVRVLKK